MNDDFNDMEKWTYSTMNEKPWMQYVNEWI